MILAAGANVGDTFFQTGSSNECLPSVCQASSWRLQCTKAGLCSSKEEKQQRRSASNAVQLASGAPADAVSL